MNEEEFKILKSKTKAICVHSYKDYWIRVHVTLNGFIYASVVKSSKPEDILFSCGNETELFDYLKTL